MGYFQAGTLLESRATTLLKSSPVGEDETSKILHAGANEDAEHL